MSIHLFLQVAIVHHLDMPIMRQRAFHIAPGTENQIPITPTLYTANPQVHTFNLNQTPNWSWRHGYYPCRI